MVYAPTDTSGRGWKCESIVWEYFIDKEDNLERGLQFWFSVIFLNETRTRTRVTGNHKLKLQENFIISNLKGPALTARYIRGSK